MRPLFIASLGNPGAEYASTYHSAGHILLTSLVAYANAPSLMRYPNMEKGEFSQPQDMAFWKSPSYMNTSGPSLVKAWKVWSAQITQSVLGDAAAKAPSPLLVVLHDDLEVDLGKYKIRSGAGLSAQGHNGLKSILSVPGMKQLNFTRFGVGIGPRPVSRHPDAVANFVLSKIRGNEKERIENLASYAWQRLAALQNG